MPVDFLKATRRRLTAIVMAIGLLGCLPSVRAAGIPQATDAPKPLTPEQSRQQFRVPDGFRMDCIAHEPQLAEPTAMCFDARGRIYVCELHGYNLDGYYDIVELNKKGVLDTAVRRIPASKEAEARARKETYGTVKLLEDSQGNGHFDRVTVLADHLPPCYGVIAARDGVIVLCAPAIVYLAAAHEPGKPTVRETLFTGFGVGELWTRISHPRWGVDNWIYCASGQSSGGTIRGPHLPRPVHLGSTCFRFKPDGSALEPVSGGTSGFGLAFTDWGDRFLCTNQQHALFVAPLPYHDLARNPYSPGMDPVQNICAYGHPARLFPISQPDPWRRKRGARPEWVKFYGADETSAGLFTSACSPTIYQADGFPEPYRGNLFACEPAQNLIHRCLLEPRGAGFVARRADADKEFLASTDSWFRPVNLTVGPDGGLYVVDMYREIIEDYSAIPRYLQQQYVQSLINGHDRGRIWRIHAAASATGRLPDFTSRTDAELVRELESPNVWRRLTVQRLLVEHRARDVIPALANMSQHGHSPLARMHALYTLDGLDALRSSSIAAALHDSHWGVRLQALKLAERWLAHEPTLLKSAVALTEDNNAKVRLQLAFTLGASGDVQALQALARLAERDGQDHWMQAAILSSAPTRAANLAATLVAGGRNTPLLRSLAAVVGARNEPSEVSNLLTTVAGLTNDTTQSLLLAGLNEGLGRGQTLRVLDSRGERACERLLRSPALEVRRQVLRLTGLVRLEHGSVILENVRAMAMKTALDDRRTLDDRRAAIDLLDDAPLHTLEPLQALLDPHQPIELQTATVHALATDRSKQVVPLLLAHWQTCTPRVQEAILAAICDRQDRLPLLLDAVAKGTVGLASLPTMRQTQLLENPDSTIRARARQLLTNRFTSADRQKVLKRYQDCLSLKRDPVRGRVVFEANCMKCHQLNGRGTAVGPDLAAVQDRPDESLLVDILDPSSTIVTGYRAYTVVAQNGTVYTGVLSAETATSVTLRREKGEQDIILRKDIDQMMASSKSLMPEGLEKEISPQDMANLIGYLRAALQPGRRRLVLFDEEPSFVRLLNEGSGRLRWTTEDHFTGKGCLKVWPPQRFAANIPGWNYAIRQKPAAGQYRHLRLAWKAPAAKGVMLELADAGQWPPADSVRGRIYAGQNTTSWKARPLSPETPRDWVVVTVDLWKECGDMTLTGLAPTAMGGPAYFDRIELLQTVDESPGRP